VRRFALRWCELNLERETITIPAAKTPAGVRSVNLLGVLHSELDAYERQCILAPGGLVFANDHGRPQSPTNVRRRPSYVMAQMGHSTPNLTLAIYARQMNRRDN
jgi:integrase